jgi:hypothetical protein
MDEMKVTANGEPIPEGKLLDVLFELHPDPKCRHCYGRGVVIRYHPSVINKRMVQPCVCIHAIMDQNDAALRLSIESVTIKGEPK